MPVAFFAAYSRSLTSLPSFTLQAPIQPATLDAWLEQGWYRSGQSLFTTHWLVMDSAAAEDGVVVSPVVWLRVDLARWQPGRRYQRLAKENAGFTLDSARCGRVPAEVEDLFSRYRAQIDFDTGPSATDILQGPCPRNFFPTTLLTVRDRGRLIAASFTDEGAESTAAILNFYDPAYSRRSLGIWLYAEGIRRAQAAGKRWHYPGYVATRYPKFDYKLGAGAAYLQGLDATASVWRPLAVK